MENISTLTQLIGSLGFPIVMCLLLFWKMNKQEERHKEEMDNLNTSLQNNTLAIQKLTDYMEGNRNED